MIVKLFIATILIAAVSSANLQSQTSKKINGSRLFCSTAQSEMTQWNVEIIRKQNRLESFTLSAWSVSNDSSHECEIKAQRSDGASRMSENEIASYIRVESDQGLALFAIQNNGSNAAQELILSSFTKSDAPVSCGTFVVPASMILKVSGPSCSIEIP
jgi:hypothetical protein